jgi:hypothetical protein
VTAWQEYYALESEFRRLRAEQRYEDAKRTLQRMIEYLEGNHASFGEVEDRIRILKARNSMICYAEARLASGEQLLRFLREAVAFSTPTSCAGQPCAELDPRLCVKRRSLLTPMQTRMCIEKISAEVNALKLEGAHAAHSFDYERALEKRRAAADMHRTVVELAPTKERIKGQDYLDYWYLVTAGYSSLMAGEFGAAKWHFSEALVKARLLDQRSSFPNYFRDLKELATHETYISGLEYFQTSRFDAARDAFQKWLDFHSDRINKTDLRFDNIKIFAMVCDILHRVPSLAVDRSDWQRLEEFMEDAYVARTTWALWTRLMFIRELSYHARLTGQPSQRDALADALSGLAGDWKFLIPDAILIGEDRIAGLLRPLVIPSFAEIYDHVRAKDDDWKLLLTQNLKNLFLILADYEWRRYAYLHVAEVALPSSTSFRAPSEKMSIPDLAGLVVRLLQRRSPKHKQQLENALKYLGAFESAVSSDNFARAVQAQKDLLNAYRSWPHVIYVEEQSSITKPVFMDENTPRFLARETTARRLWNQEPKQIIFEGVQDLTPGGFYYLRPRWNVRSHTRYRIRHERFLRSDTPHWVSIFADNLLGRGPALSEKYRDWIVQFNDKERLLACRLLGMLRYYGQDNVRRLWLGIYRNQLPPEAKTGDVAYFSLGHAAKSGALNQYYFRQAMSQLSENERSFEFKKAFRDIAEVDDDLRKPRTVVFVDDFVGTGLQAIRHLGSYFDQHPWLGSATVYYCSLIGFENGVADVKKALEPRVKNVFLAKRLAEKDKAFSEQNTSWESAAERELAEQWAGDIGRQVLDKRVDYDSERDKLGWSGSQALVCLFYNIPNNTLPLFWGTGKRNGIAWNPLFDRFD